MENTETPEESWRTEELSDHPKNDEIYGDKGHLKQSFIDSVEKFGIRVPLAVTHSGTIVSGHRRLEAATRVGLDEVPVKILNLDDDLDIREALIDYNRHRDKKYSQRMREGEEIEAIERERAKERQGDRTDIRDSCPNGGDEEFGRTRDKVAEIVGSSSGKTFQREKAVWEAAKEGRSVAQEQVELLDQGDTSPYGAWRKVKEDQTDSNDSDDATKNPRDEETLDPDDMILSAHCGTSDKVFPKVLDLHVEDNALIADVTYGNGTFWKQVPENRYQLRATDINPDRSPSTDHGIDYRDLPYDDGEIDVVVLDPPYRSGFYDGDREIEATQFWIEDRYAGPADGELKYHPAVLNEYSVAGREARRVLGDDGTLIIKVQDEVSMDEQHLTHQEVTEIYEQKIGFSVEDLFVIVRPDTPTIGVVKNQKRARKNHSYFMVFN